MEKQKKKQKGNKRKHNRRGNWRKSTASAILAVACIMSLAVAMAPVAAESAKINIEYDQHQHETYPLATEAPSTENSQNVSKEPNSKTPEEDHAQIQSIGTHEKLDDITQEPSSSSDKETEVKPTEPDEPTTQAEPDPTQETTVDPSDSTEQQSDEQIPNIPSEGEQQTEGEVGKYFPSTQKLDEVLASICAERGQNQAWRSSGKTNWIEQYEPFTEQLVIKVGNMIYQEVGGFISTQSYYDAMTAYMLTGSVLLHRREVSYTMGATSLYDEMHASSQYGSAWAFDIDTPRALKDNVDECYIVAELLLRNGPIGPRNLLGQSGDIQGPIYWQTPPDPIYITVYFCTSSLFEDYDT